MTRASEITGRVLRTSEGRNGKRGAEKIGRWNSIVPEGLYDCHEETVPGVKKEKGRFWGDKT